MEVRRISPKELHKCCWCKKEIGSLTPVYGLGAKLRPSVDLSEYQGTAIEVALANQSKRVPMIVTAADSEAKQEGKDVIFMLCSEKCGKEMKAVLEEEVSLFDRVFERLKGIQG